MKIPLQDVLAKSTPGPFRAEDHWIIGGWHNCGVAELHSDGTHESRINAALLAHCRNKLPGLLAAAKAIMGLGDMHDEGDEWVDEFDVLERAIADAESVEVPG